MSTRSNVGIINADGSVTAIYVHNDGYPSHNGRILLNHYNTEDKVRELLKLGDLSILGEVIGEKHNFDVHDFTTKWCRAYGRDRGEKGTKARKHKTVKEACSSFDNDYAYLFDPTENRWSFREYDGPFEPLTSAACAKD